MERLADEVLPVARSQPRSRTALILEALALRHQIAVLKQPNSAALLPPLGSAVLDLAVVVVAKLARKPADRPAADGLALAPLRLVQILEISFTPSLERWAAQGFR